MVRELNLMLRAPRLLAVALALASCLTARAGEVDLSGFALLRAASGSDTAALPVQPLAAQVQIGIDWRPTARLSAHVHLLARDAQRNDVRGIAGIPEAFAELNLNPRDTRVRIRAGAMFLSTSRENIDALWENAYAISSSALNSWLGEELRPIGVDATVFRRGVMGGATVFRGNDTFGAIPPARGWSLDDHWTLLGEWIPVDAEYFTSVSAETDHRLGWSVRGGWSNDRFSLQGTHIDNRSDALDKGRLFNWNTRFDIIGADYTTADWTFAAESGWGPTFLIVRGVPFVSNIRASYALASRRLSSGRVTLRFDEFDNGPTSDRGITVAWFWSPRDWPRIGVEVTRLRDDQRITAEVRYHFARH
jgi:hypothetical protein